MLREPLHVVTGIQTLPGGKRVLNWSAPNVRAITPGQSIESELEGNKTRIVMGKTPLGGAGRSPGQR